MSKGRVRSGPKRVGLTCLLSAVLLLTAPVQAAEPKAEEALDRARNALRDAMDALAEAGRLSLDQQLPKLREQTDQTLQDAHKLLEQWEGKLRQELEKQKKEKAPETPPVDPDTKGKAEVLPRI
ncbi:MAG: hypothetical protein H7836_02565 [Magnetococcus sp. YQC-3]